MLVQGLDGLGRNVDPYDGGDPHVFLDPKLGQVVGVRGGHFSILVLV